MAREKVFIASSVGKGKEYALPLLKGFYEREAYAGDTVFTVVDDAEGVEGLQGETVTLPPFKGSVGRSGRIARVREVIRKKFLESDCNWLYWHDCDMEPEQGIIERLMEIGSFVSGLYICRSQREPLAPIMLTVDQGAYATALVNCSIFEEPYPKVLGVGFGCLLMSREIAEKTAFRDPKWYDKNFASEDYQYCLDTGIKPVVNTQEVVWHVDEKGNGVLPIVGEPVFSVVYVGHAQAIHNKYGYWERGIPHTDITEEQASTLHSEEFKTGIMHSVNVEIKQFL